MTWYSVERFRGLMAAEIEKAHREGSPVRTVADFIGDFRGLSATAKRREIADNLGIARMHIDDFFAKGETDTIGLMDELAAYSGKPVKARDLGLIGEEHLRDLFLTTKPASFQYRKVEVEVEGVPYLAEVAFAWAPHRVDRLMVSGLNWSVMVLGDPFKYLVDETSEEGYAQSLDTLLTDHYAGEDEPIEFFLHVASPDLHFTDRGKTTVDLPPEVDQAIVAAVIDVTKAWTKQRRAEEKDASAARKRDQKLAKAEKPMEVKEAAYLVMESAYAAASDNNTLPANARQVMYAARPTVLELTGEKKLNDIYFTQTLLPDFMADNAAKTKDWDIVWSDRGHFAEPHTGERIGLGTLAVRGYVQSYTDAPTMKAAELSPAKVETHGPAGRYGGMLYIEKEGFDPLIERAEIAARHDLAFMSCKGLSVTAARMLVDETCARFKLPLFILHDFDITGFSIAATLHQSNRRYQFKNQSGTDFKVFDFGLRLEDIEWFAAQGHPLAVEEVNLAKIGKKPALRETLKANGATPEEIEFLLTGDEHTGQRVELNAMTSRQFVDFIERKLAAHNLKKVIPAPALLADAFRLFTLSNEAEARVKAILNELAAKEVAIPKDLAKRVAAYLKAHPTVPWDAAVAAIVKGAKG